MKRYLIISVCLLFLSCSTAPVVEVNNPHESLLPKIRMTELIKQRYFSFIHCRNAEVTLLEIKPIIYEGGREIIPVIAKTDFQEIKGLSGWLKSSVTALYHFYKNDDTQWKVEKIKEFKK